MNSQSDLNKGTYDLIAKAYTDNQVSRNLWQEQMDEFAAKMPKGAEIVDLGCGAGTETVWFARNIPGCRITGVDFSEGMLDLARRNGDENAEWNLESISEYQHPVPADGVWARGSLHHLSNEELAAAFRRIASYLKPGGVFCCINKHGDGENIEVSKRYGGEARRYFNFFSEGMIERLAEGSGLKVLSEAQCINDEKYPYLVSYLTR